MAKFSPPSEFKFESPTEWPEWKQRFRRYRLATKLSTDDGEIQVSPLIYAMGSESEKIFSSFEFEEEDDKKDFEVVMKKFDDYFIPHHTQACMFLPTEPAIWGNGGDVHQDII